MPQNSEVIKYKTDRFDDIKIDFHMGKINTYKVKSKHKAGKYICNSYIKELNFFNT